MLVVVKKTSMTPEHAHVGAPTAESPTNLDVDISCVFTEHKRKALEMAEGWKEHGCRVRVGGPAFGDPGGEFTPGKYIKLGAVITHRGCNRSCPWCYVPKREGKIRELKVTEGNLLQDNNILACSKQHKDLVFSMLRKQKQVSLKGGLDCRILTDGDVEDIRSLHLKDLWVAYDSKATWKYTKAGVEKLLKAGVPKYKIRCYVMIGFNETMGEAAQRLREIYDAGTLPFAQLYDRYVEPDLLEWKKFARLWARPAIYKSIVKADKLLEEKL